ncbi:hypothetical protein B0T26DRAFT_607828, partial [Lasiosphaeria miniovina]
IFAGTWIAVYLGEVIPEGETEKSRQKSMYSFTVPAIGNGDTQRGGAPGFEIDGRYYGGMARFFNHDCMPNMRASPEQVGKMRFIAFQAARDIHAGEELTLHYGIEFFHDHGLKCYC